MLAVALDCDLIGYNKIRGVSVMVLEPSNEAVYQAISLGLDARVGTADVIPFQDKSFDIVIFGFCLYLCDRDDLFKIAAEADRVLKTPGWLLIKDFYSHQSADLPNPY